MPISVAEYLGQRVDVEDKVLRVDPTKDNLCPFMSSKCVKTPRYQPICSVRNTEGDLWIVCSHRLCATRKNILLSEYQKARLLEVARAVFGEDIKPEDVLIKKEIPMDTGSGSDYSADYIMAINNPKSTFKRPTRVVLEMQGGGETSGTGHLTKHVTSWIEKGGNDNKLLSKPISNVGTIVTNAWRRQQEQFLVKGNIAVQSGAGMVFCVGELLYNSIYNKIKNSGLRDLKEYNWTLALVCFSEDKTSSKNGPIPLKINPDKTLFTNYSSFVRALTDQGNPNPSIFSGKFKNLLDQEIKLD